MYNSKVRAGSKIISVKTGGSPLKKGLNYTLSTSDYAARGSDGYSVFKKGKVIIDTSGATLLAGTVMNYIKAKGAVSPKVEGRIVGTVKV